MTHRAGHSPAQPPVVQRFGARLASPWPLAFAAGAIIVASVFWAVIATPGDLQQRDLYPSLDLDRVVEHSVYPLWSPRGTVNIAGTGRLPITLVLVGVAKALGLDGATYARLIVLWIAGVGYVSAFAAFALFARWRPSIPRTCAAIGAMVAGVAFVVNPWAIARLEHSWLLAQWAMVPLVLALFLEGTRTTRRRWTVASALAFALLGAAQPHYLVFTALMVVAWTIGTMVQCPVQRRRALIDGLVWAAALVPLLAYQIAPFVAVKLFSGGSPDPAYTLTDQTRTVLSRFQDLPTTLQGAANANWHELLVPAGAERLPWELAGWAVAVLPLAAVALRRWGPPALFLAVGGYAAALVADRFSLDAHGRFYQTAVNSVPGLWVFREPDRVVGLLIVAQAFGAGFVIADLLGRSAAGWRTRRALGPALVAGYVGLALGVHAIPAIPLLWSADGSGYVPRPLPGDYRSVLDAADTAAGPAGRTLVVSSDERYPPWDAARTVRLMEAASLANPSLTGDTRSPVPPAPVAGRWFEFIYGIEPSAARQAAQRAGFSHMVVIRDHPDGDELAAALAAMPEAEVLESGLNALALELGAAAPLLESIDAVWVDGLEAAPDDAAGILANHRARPAVSGAGAPAQPTADAVFAIDDDVALLPVTGWFGFHGSLGGWTRSGAYADERQTWLKQLAREDLEDWASDYGLGLAFAKPEGMREALVIDTPGHRDRAVWLRVFTSPRSTWIDVAASQGSVRLTTRSATSGWRWMRVGPAADGGVGVTAGPGLEAVSTLALAPTEWRPATAQDPTPLVKPRIDVTARGPTRIEATARDAGGWSFIVLREAYDPAWLAWVDGEAFAPLLADGLWNGYLVPVTDGAALTFEYAPQRWYDIGIAIAAVTAGGLATCLIITSANCPWCRSLIHLAGRRRKSR